MPNEPAIWVASRRAVEAFGLGDGEEGAPVRRIKYGRLNHDLAVNDCRVHVMRASREPGIELLSWRSEVELRATTIRHGVLPDALFQVARDDASRSPKATFALECEVSEKDSPLVRLPWVRRLAEGRYRGRTCADGLALREALRLTLDGLASDFEGTAIGTLAAGLRIGNTQASVARGLGFSEEYLCRRWKPQLVRLLREQLSQQEFTPMDDAA